MTLGDFGADVIKVEPPGTGDHSRNTGPFVNGQSYPFAMPNRNKRSIALNLKAPEGLDIARRLITRADMVVENFRPGVAGKLGIGYEDARALNEEIIYCSISGFGQTGPESRRPGFDIIAQGMAGFLRMTGPPGGDPANSVSRSAIWSRVSPRPTHCRPHISAGCARAVASTSTSRSSTPAWR